MITQNSLVRTSKGMQSSFSETVESKQRADSGEILETWFEQVKIEMHIDL